MPKLSVKAVLLTQGKKENDLATIYRKCEIVRPWMAFCISYPNV
jgi:hypothetical protein